MRVSETVSSVIWRLNHDEISEDCAMSSLNCFLGQYWGSRFNLWYHCVIVIGFFSGISTYSSNGQCLDCTKVFPLIVLLKGVSFFWWSFTELFIHFMLVHIELERVARPVKFFIHINKLIGSFHDSNVVTKIKQQLIIKWLSIMNKHYVQAGWARKTCVSKPALLHFLLAGVYTKLSNYDSHL